MARILVVDDEALIRENYVALLLAQGHEVEQACGGFEARRMIEEAPAGRFDLVVSDLIMPRGHGFDLIAYCRSLPMPPLILAVCGKGNPIVDYLDYAMACGADAALEKSAMASEFLAHIDPLLGASGCRAPFERRPIPNSLLWPAALLRLAARPPRGRPFQEPLRTAE